MENISMEKVFKVLELDYDKVAKLVKGDSYKGLVKLVILLNLTPYELHEVIKKRQENVSLFWKELGKGVCETTEFDKRIAVVGYENLCEFFGIEPDRNFKKLLMI
jgi:hypothetical protein